MNGQGYIKTCWIRNKIWRRRPFKELEEGRGRWGGGEREEGGGERGGGGGSSERGWRALRWEESHCCIGSWRSKSRVNRPSTVSCCLFLSWEQRRPANSLHLPRRSYWRGLNSLIVNPKTFNSSPSKMRVHVRPINLNTIQSIPFYKAIKSRSNVHVDVILSIRYQHLILDILYCSSAIICPAIVIYIPRHIKYHN